MISPFFWKSILPSLFCLLIILLSEMPESHLFFVTMVFIPIYYFAIFNPRYLNEISVFGLGLFTDLISQTPFGLFSFLFVLLFFIARLNRLFLKELSFQKLWILFIICVGLLLLIQLFLFTICQMDVVNTGFLFIQFWVLSLIYPLGIKLCIKLDSWIGGSREFMDI